MVENLGILRYPYMSCVVSTLSSTFLTTDQTQNNPGCTATEDEKGLEILDVENRGLVLSMQQRTKLLVTCMVSAV